jgi:dipeptidyl aminopeptidase/acylaminoacyl peptidase
MVTRRSRRVGLVGAAVAAAVLLASCTSGEAGAPPDPGVVASGGSPSTSADPMSTDAAPTDPAAPSKATDDPAGTPVEPSGPSSPAVDAAAPLPPVTDPVSLPALMREDVRGSKLRLGRVLARTDAYTRYAVTYRADDLRISGVMNVPDGKGPFPVVVLLHGYIDPDVYVTGQGYRREQDSLARNGYVAFHVDYRNHAGSDDDPRNDVDLRLGYARDTIAAVEAVRTSRLRFLDGERVGMIGRSMGGGVAFNALVARPGLVDAAVTYASVSTDAVDNYNRWIRFADGRRELAARIEAKHGAPEDNPRFWRGISSRNYFDRIDTPVMVHHGVVDDTCPIAWSRATVKALRAADVDLTYHEYSGEGHYFYGGWAQSMRRTLAFLDRHLAA